MPSYILKLFFIIFVSSHILAKEKKEKGEIVKAYVQPPLKPPTKKEIEKICKQHRDSYISFSGEVFYINKKCLRTRIDDDATYTRKKKVQITEVNSTVIKALTLEPTKKQRFSQKEKKQIIKKHEDRCLINSETIYQIKKGYKRAFPDWPSYKGSRCKKLEYVDSELLEIFPEGETYSSVLDSDQPQMVYENIEDYPRKSDQKKCLKRPKNELISYFDTVYQRVVNKKGFCFYSLIDDQNKENRKLIARSKITVLSDKDYLSLPFKTKANK